MSDQDSDPMLLLVDNYDSFTFNLARYGRRLGAEVSVVRNDAADLEQQADQAAAVLISPGPCGPEQAGRCLTLVQRFSGRLPILGICLGHQVICRAWGGRIVRAQRPIHGRALPVELSADRLFEGIGSGARFARYHSLVADPATLPDCLEVIAWSVCETVPDRAVSALSTPPVAREIMAVRHRQHLTYGVQFHPESILSADGYRLLRNFFLLGGLPCSRDLPSSDLREVSSVERPASGHGVGESNVGQTWPLSVPWDKAAGS